MSDVHVRKLQEFIKQEVDNVDARIERSSHRLSLLLPMFM